MPQITTKCNQSAGGAHRPHDASGPEIKPISKPPTPLPGPLRPPGASQGYRAMPPLQAQAIPPVLAGRDVVGCPQPGPGKTAAFALPILQRLSSPSPLKGEGRGEGENAHHQTVQAHQ